MARAANIAHACGKFFRSLRTSKLEPDVFHTKDTSQVCVCVPVRLLAGVSVYACASLRTCLSAWLMPVYLCVHCARATAHRACVPADSLVQGAHVERGP